MKNLYTNNCANNNISGKTFSYVHVFFKSLFIGGKPKGLRKNYSLLPFSFLSRLLTRLYVIPRWQNAWSRYSHAQASWSSATVQSSAKVCKKFRFGNLPKRTSRTMNPLVEVIDSPSPKAFSYNPLKRTLLHGFRYHWTHIIFSIQSKRVFVCSILHNFLLTVFFLHPHSHAQRMWPKVFSRFSFLYFISTYRQSLNNIHHHDGITENAGFK